MPAAHMSLARRPLPVALIALAGLAPVLSLAFPSPTRAALYAVGVLDGSFSPATLTITVGDSVTWTNEDDSPHTVTAANGAFDSGNLDANGAFTFTFTEAGTFAYFCNYHDEMQATIVVEPAAAPAAPAQPGAGTSAPPAQAPTSGSATDAASSAAHAGGTHDGSSQPDTALPVPVELRDLLAPMLIGLGLVALAFGLVPIGAGPRTEPEPVVMRGSTGWRR